MQLSTSLPSVLVGMQMFKPFLRLLTVIILAGLLVGAGCNHYEVTSGNVTSLTTPADTSLSQTLPTATGDGIDWGGEFVPPREGQGDHDIRVYNFECSPNVLIVKVGTTVTWQNMDFKPFSVISDIPGFFSGEILALGGTYSYTFTQPGTFSYGIDPYDASCRGIVVVQ
jgi:plastocyanin